MDVGSRDVSHDEGERECLHLHNTGVLDWLAYDITVVNKHQVLDDRLVDGMNVVPVVIVAVQGRCSQTPCCNNYECARGECFTLDILAHS